MSKITKVLYDTDVYEWEGYDEDMKATTYLDEYEVQEAFKALEAEAEKAFTERDELKKRMTKEWDLNLELVTEIQDTKEQLKKLKDKLKVLRMLEDDGSIQADMIDELLNQKL